MIWFILEAGLALALLIFIVWWTLPRKKREEEGVRPVVSEVEGSEEEKRRIEH
ncbi:MAG: hypothetical protein ACREV0_12875 [Burkholderiales bacterium]